MSERAVLYARVSTRDSGTNLADQIGLCREVAEREGYTVLAEHKEPEHTSGASDYPPELSNIIELAEQGDFDVLVCRSLTRLARSITKQFRVESTLKKLGVRIEYYKYKFPDTPEGKLQKNIHAVLAEYERENIAYRTHYGKRKMVEAGKVYVNGIAPYGYIEENATQGDDVIERTLKVVPEEAEVVQEIFEMFTSDRSVSAASIARHLTAKGIAPPGHTRYVGEQFRLASNDAWYGQTIQLLLKRKTYVGTWEYGKKGVDETIPVAVPPIVDKSLWDKAQAKIASTAKSRAYVDKYPYLARDLAHCGICGTPMNCKSDTRPNRPRYYSYWCSKAHHTVKEKCAHGLTYRADMIDRQLWNDVKQIVSDPATLKDAYAKYMKSLTTRVNPSEKQLTAKQKLIRTNKIKLEKLLDIYLDSDISKKQYQQRKSKLEDAMNRHKAEADNLTLQIEAQNDALAKTHSLDQYIDRLPKLLQFATGNKEAQMEILKRLGVAVIMYPDEDYKSVDWALFGAEYAREPNTMLASYLSVTEKLADNSQHIAVSRSQKD